MIGGEATTSDNEFVNATFEDLGKASDSPVDVSEITKIEIIDDQFDF